MAKSSSPMSVMIFWALFDDLFLGPSRKEPRICSRDVFSIFLFHGAVHFSELLLEFVLFLVVIYWFIVENPMLAVTEPTEICHNQ